METNDENKRRSLLRLLFVNDVVSDECVAYLTSCCHTAQSFSKLICALAGLVLGRER